MGQLSSNFAPAGHTNTSMDSYGLGTQFCGSWLGFLTYLGVNQLSELVKDGFGCGERGPGEHTALSKPRLGVTYCHFYHILLTKAKHKPRPIQGMGKQTSSLNEKSFNVSLQRVWT